MQLQQPSSTMLVSSPDVLEKRYVWHNSYTKLGPMQGLHQEFVMANQIPAFHVPRLERSEGDEAWFWLCDAAASAVELCIGHETRNYIAA